MVNIDEFLQYSQRLKLLYVEDNDDSWEMTSIALSEFFQDIVVATNCNEGFEKFVRDHTDIILTDINIPELNGLQMIKK